MTLEQIKADIARRGWRIEKYGACWSPMSSYMAGQMVGVHVGTYTYDGEYETTEYEAVKDAYEKALAGEGVDAPSPLLTWDEAKAALLAEGFDFDIHLAQPDYFHESQAWQREFGTCAGTVETCNPDPVDAINDLLTKARERWPASHPFDAMNLCELLDVCDERGWRWALMAGGNNRCDDHSGQIYVQLSGGQFSGWGESREETLRTYMMLREKG
jgi:hypothetical protein